MLITNIFTPVPGATDISAGLGGVMELYLWENARQTKTEEQTKRLVFIYTRI